MYLSFNTKLYNLLLLVGLKGSGKTFTGGILNPVSDHRLKEINERALLVDLPWNLEIDNSEFQDETAIVESVRRLLQ